MWAICGDYLRVYRGGTSLENIRNTNLADLESILELLGYKGEGIGGKEWYKAYNKLTHIIEAVGILTEEDTEHIIQGLDIIDGSENDWEKIENE